MRYVLTEFYYFSVIWRVFQLRKIHPKIIDETLKIFRRDLVVAKIMKEIEI